MKKSMSMDRADLHLKIVHEISDLINRAEGLDSILNATVRKIASALHFDVVSIYLYDKVSGQLVLRATRGLQFDIKHPIRLLPHEGLTGFVFETHHPFSITPASEHSRYKFFPESGEKIFESYLGVPLILHNRCLGVLVGQRERRHVISPADQTLFEIIASRLSGLLEVSDHLKRLQEPYIKETSLKAYQGRGVSGGFAVGKAYILKKYSPSVYASLTKIEDVNKEIELFQKALETAIEELHQLIDQLKQEGTFTDKEIDIFNAHLIMLGDQSFQKEVLDIIRSENKPAEHAVIQVMERFCQKFQSIPDTYLGERAADFRHLGEKLTEHLYRVKGLEITKEEIPKGSIIVAHDISPIFLAKLQKGAIKGIITEEGGETSHVVILARSLDIPAVIGVEDVSSEIKQGEEVLVDGRTGFVFLNPYDELIREYESSHLDNKQLMQTILSELESSPASNDIDVSLSSNIGFLADIETAKSYGIKHIGLFRTELAFMRYNDWPSFDQQVELYSEVAREFSDGFVTIRTLDIGGDKLLPYAIFPSEENPLLGFRSIRFSMEHIDIFRDQIAAIVEASKLYGNLRILLPMITSKWEVETASETLSEAIESLKLPVTHKPKLGVQIEVPAIIYQLEDYKDLIDFFAIGTNDFTQYLLAADRNSTRVGHIYSGFHPAVIRALNDIFTRGTSIGKELSICGEMAGAPKGALLLMALGFRHLSVAPSSAPVIRHLIQSLCQKDLDRIRTEILDLKSESDARLYLSDELNAIDPILQEIDS